jgi:hypothetical protein
MDKPIDSSTRAVFIENPLDLLLFYAASAQVQEWMKELDGYNIPDFSPTVDGSCVNDTGTFFFAPHVRRD